MLEGFGTEVRTNTGTGGVNVEGVPLPGGHDVGNTDYRPKINQNHQIKNRKQLRRRGPRANWSVNVFLLNV